MVTGLVFLATPLVLLAVRNRLMPVFLSPTCVTAGVIWILGLAGWWLYPYLQGVAGGGIVVSLPEHLADKTARLIAVSVLAMALGAAVGGVLRTRIERGHRLRPVETAPAARSWLLVGSLLPLAMVLVGAGPQFLLDRDTYQPTESVASISVLGNQAAVAAVAVLGFLFAKERGVRRFYVIAATVSYFALFLSYGSRRMALLPVVMALGAFAAQPGRRTRRWMVIGGLASLLLLPVPLILRSQYAHGLFPYLQVFPDLFGSQLRWEEVVNNVIVFFPITALSAYGIPPIPTHALLLELNPLPGRWIGWYEISSTLGLNAATPYSGIGEMGNAGWSWVWGVWFSIGLLLMVLESAAARAMRDGRQVFAVGIVGLAALFAVTVTQYNFRNAQRDLVYALALAVLVFVLPRRQREDQPAAEDGTGAGRPG